MVDTQFERVRVFQCPNCHEFIATHAEQCRFCGFPIERDRAEATADVLEGRQRSERLQKAWRQFIGGGLLLLPGLALLPLGILAYGLLGTAIALCGTGLIGILDDWRRPKPNADVTADAPPSRISQTLGKVNSWSGFVIGLGVAGALAVAFVGYLLIDNYAYRQEADEKAANERRLAHQFAEANEQDRLKREKLERCEHRAAELVRAASLQLAPKPYSQGGLVILDKDILRYSDLHEKLDDAWRAAAPEEVRTVVTIHSAHEKIGEYKSPDPNRYTALSAYKRICTVEVIDATIPAVIARKVFTTAPSRKVFIADGPDGYGRLATEATGTSSMGARPDGEILDFILALPEKKTSPH
jgi:hypothetical protein